MSGIARRRLVALTLAAAATAAVWLVVFRDSDSGSDRGRGGGRGVSDPVAALVRDLSLAEQIDQVLLLGFDGTTPTAPILDEVSERKLGGVIVRAENFTDQVQLATLTGSIRAAGLRGGAPQVAGPAYAPLIAAAQEGGAYRSFETMPPALTELEVGDSGSIALAERWAREAGEALRAAGIDLNLFPVADVATLDSPLADRAFSDDPALTAALTAAAVRGCRAARIICAALHFPGLGAASQDTNQGPATVALDIAGLDQRDLEAFRAAFAEDVPAIVLSHAFYSAYDAVTPGSLAEPIATELLRDRLDYEGVAITDDLGAGAIRAGYSVSQAAVAALGAGADLLQIAAPEDQRGVREALAEAVESGLVSEARLAEAAGRVLELKRAHGALRLP